MECEFEAALPLIIELIRWCEAHAEKQAVTVAGLAAALSRPRAEIYRLFDLLGLVPATWEEPEIYSVETLLEACTRHEIAARY